MMMGVFVGLVMLNFRVPIASFLLWETLIGWLVGWFCLFFVYLLGLVKVLIQFTVQPHKQPSANGAELCSTRRKNTGRFKLSSHRDCS